MNVKAIFAVMIYKGPTGYLFNGPTKEYIGVVKLGIIQCMSDLKQTSLRHAVTSSDRKKNDFSLPRHLNLLFLKTSRFSLTRSFVRLQ